MDSMVQYDNTALLLNAQEGTLSITDVLLAANAEVNVQGQVRPHSFFVIIIVVVIIIIIILSFFGFRVGGGVCVSRERDAENERNKKHVES